MMHKKYKIVARAEKNGVSLMLESEVFGESIQSAWEHFYNHINLHFNIEPKDVHYHCMNEKEIEEGMPMTFGEEE